MRLDFYPPDRRHRDRDNLLAHAKSALDGIASALGVNDRRFVPTVKLHETTGGYVEVTIDE